MGNFCTQHWTWMVHSKWTEGWSEYLVRKVEFLGVQQIKEWKPVTVLLVVHQNAQVAVLLMCPDSWIVDFNT